MARYASAAKAQAVWRLPDDRRAATLLAFIRTLEASASDDVIDLFDAVSTSMFSEASTAAKQARLRSLRDLDAAALKLRDAAIVILDPETPDDAVRSAVFQLIDTSTLAAAVERVGELAEPHGDTYFSELRKFNRKIGYTPDLLTAESQRRALRKAAARGDRISSCRSFRAQAQWATANRLCAQTMAATDQIGRRLPRSDRLSALCSRWPSPRHPPARCLSCQIVALCRLAQRTAIRSGVGSRSSDDLPHCWRIQRGRGRTWATVRTA